MGEVVEIGQDVNNLQPGDRVVVLFTIACGHCLFWGMLYPIETVLPHMQARRSGRIVNITSIVGKVGIPHLLPYTCAKFAAVGLSEGLRTELGSQGIVVTTIGPGLRRSRIAAHQLNQIEPGPKSWRP